MVYQGTVLGPLLWLVFFADASKAIIEAKFNEIIFANDLSAYKCYLEGVRNSTLLKHADKCQENLHKWGKANQVEFEPKKEIISILSRDSPHGPGFTLLGVYFDTSLKMLDAITKLHCAASWKLTRILRSRRYYETDEIIGTYKAKLLSYLEYRTPTIYHADASKLEKIDGIQKRLMNEVGLTEVDALLEYHLAPLATRRDIAMLGVIHRSVLGLGPVQFQHYFRPNGAVTNPGGRYIKKKDTTANWKATGAAIS